MNKFSLNTSLTSEQYSVEDVVAHFLARYLKELTRLDWAVVYEDLTETYDCTSTRGDSFGIEVLADDNMHDDTPLYGILNMEDVAPDITIDGIRHYVMRQW